MRLILVFFCLLALGSQASPVVMMERQTPLPFGLGVGSIVEHRIDIFAPSPLRLDPTQLPAPGPYNDWLEIRSLELKTMEAQEGTHYQLMIEFQIFPALKRSTELEIPSLPLYFLSTSGNGPLQDEIPAWRFTASPLIPENVDNSDVKIRALWQPIPLPLLPRLKKLAIIASGLLIVAAMLTWQQKWFPWQSSPFSRIRSRIHHAIEQKQPQQAFRLFHQALNETAGYAVFQENLPLFLRQHPHFASLEADLNRFFEDSLCLFFADRLLPQSLPRLERLSKHCAQVEKGCRK